MNIQRYNVPVVGLVVNCVALLVGDPLVRIPLVATFYLLERNVEY